MVTTLSSSARTLGGTLAVLALTLLAGCVTKPAAVYTGSLTGSVRFSDLSDASGLVVTLSGPAGDATLTDASGNYTFIGLPPGTYAVAALAKSTVESQQVVTIDVPRNGPATAPDIVFTAVGDLKGRAVSLDGTAAGILVVAQGTGVSTLTGADGTYLLQHLPAGTVDVIASLAGRQSAAAGGLVIQRGRTKEAPDLVLGSAGSTNASGAISGTVFLDGVGTPAGLTVSLQGPVSSARVTASDGSYSFTGLSDGRYVVTAFARSTKEKAISRAVSVQGAPVSGNDAHFSPVGLVRGKALEPGSPATQAGIAVVAQGTTSQTLTDPLGRYQLVDLPIGANTLVASRPGSGSVRATVQVVYDAETPLDDLTLVPDPRAPGALTGTAQLAGLSDHSPIVVTVLGPVARSARAQADGSFSLADLPAGDYLVSASAPSTIEPAVTHMVTIGATTSALADPLVLTPAGALAGRVVLEGGGAGGAIVFAVGTQLSTITDGDGTFTLPGVPAGTPIALQAMLGAAATPLVPVAATTYATTTHAPDLEIHAAGSYDPLNGGVLSPAGTAIAGASVTAVGPDTFSTTTDSRGAFSLRALDGLYALQLTSGLFNARVPAALVMPGGTGSVWGKAGPVALPPVVLQAGVQMVSNSRMFAAQTAAYSDNAAVRAGGDAIVITDTVDPYDYYARGQGLFVTQDRVVSLPGTTGLMYSGLYQVTGPQIGPLHTALTFGGAASYQSGALFVTDASGTSRKVASGAPNGQTIRSGGSKIAFGEYLQTAQGQYSYLRTADVLTGATATIARYDSGNPMGVTPHGESVLWSASSPASGTFAAPTDGCGAASTSTCPLQLSTSTNWFVDWNPDGRAGMLSVTESQWVFKIVSADLGSVRTLATDPNNTYYPLPYFSRGQDTMLAPYIAADGSVQIVAVDPQATPVQLLAADANLQYGLSTQASATFGVVSRSTQTGGQAVAYFPLSLASAPGTLPEAAAQYTLFGSTLAWVSNIDGRLHVTELTTGDDEVVESLPLPSSGACCFASPQGDSFVYLVENTTTSTPVAEVRQWRRGLAGVTTLSTEFGSTYSSIGTYSADGRWLALYSGSTLLLLDLQEGTTAAASQVYSLNNSPYSPAGFLTDGSFVAMMYTPTTNYTICRVRTPTPTNRDGRASTADVQAFMRTPLQQYVTGSQSIYWAPDHSSLAAMGQSYTSNGGYDYTAVDVFGLRAGDDAPSLWIAGAEYDQLRAYQLKAGFHTSADGRYIAIRANFSDGDTRAQASDSGPYSGVTHPRYLGDLMLIDLARGTVTTLATNVGEPGVWLGDGRLLYQRWYSPEPLSFQDGLYLLTPPRSAP